MTEYNLPHELVDEVIRELKRRLRQEDHPADPPRKRVVVLGTLTENDESVLASRYEILDLSGRASPQTAADTASGLTDSARFGEYDLVIVSRLPVTILAQAALGCPVNQEAVCLVSALLEGKPVYLLKNGIDYRRFRDTAHMPLFQLYQSYEDTLIRFGARLLSELSDLPAIPETIPHTAPSADLTRRKLLTEADVQKARKSGVLLIGASTLVTPLAQEYIRSHGLQVLRQ